MIPTASVFWRFARGLVELARERLLDGAPQVDVRDADVDVAVEQPGQDRPVADVDLDVAVEPGAEARRSGRPRSRRRRASGAAAGPVEHAAAGQDGSGHAGSSITSSNENCWNGAVHGWPSAIHIVRVSGSQIIANRIVDPSSPWAGSGWTQMSWPSAA